jgi:hypothetical protein
MGNYFFDRIGVSIFPNVGRPRLFCNQPVNRRLLYHLELRTSHASFTLTGTAQLERTAARWPPKVIGQAPLASRLHAAVDDTEAQERPFPKKILKKQQGRKTLAGLAVSAV